MKILKELFLILIFVLSIWGVLFFTLIVADEEAKRYFENTPIKYWKSQ